MTIDEFRTKSEQGGFDTTGMSDAEVFLSPKSFQAVGKVEGWLKYAVCQTHGKECELNCRLAYPFEWQYQMHRMIDALAEGKTLKEFIETL